MALMYPSGLYSGVKSPGEKEVFERLRDDPRTKDWIVLHSLDISEHKCQLQGEIDFVIIVPYKGILCLEVKAVTRIRRQGGTWYLGANPKADYRGPFKQASEAMHSIRTYLSKSSPELSRVVFFSAVLFPYVNFDAQSAEWHQWQAIDQTQYRSYSMGEIVDTVLDKARIWLSQNPNAHWFNIKSKQPSIEEANRIAKILRPSFEYFELPETRSRRRDSELKNYTEEQFEALDAMSSNPRVIFEGPAGTGKTVLAMEAARRAKFQDRRVLFICYNQLLGRWLAERMKPLRPQVTVATLHAHMLSVSNRNVPDNPGVVFWERELPESAIDNLLKEPSGSNVYDAIVLDEAQDIVRNIYLDFLDLSVNGGLKSGLWRMFGDFRKQSIYETENYGAERLLKERFPKVPRYSLRVNCRNPVRIAEYVQLLGGLNPPYSRIRRPDNRYTPVIRTYRHNIQQKDLLAHELRGLEKEGVPDSEIVILSFKADDKSIINRLSNKWQVKLRSLRERGCKSAITYGSVYSFKGLEAPTVIVTDVTSVEKEKARALFYIAVSRAVERLFIFLQEEARENLLNKLLGLGKEILR